MAPQGAIPNYSSQLIDSKVLVLTAPLSLINALLVSLGMHRKEHIQSSLESLETLWSQYRVYETGRDRTTEDGDIL